MGGSVAVAQEEPEEGIAAPSDLPMTSQRVSFAKGHLWKSTGLTTPIEAIATTHSGTLVALAGDGSVYRRSPDQSWRMVLGPPGIRLDDPFAVDEERLLLDAEGFLYEQEDHGALTPDELRGRSRTADDDDGVEGEDEAEPRYVHSGSEAVDDVMADMVFGADAVVTGVGPRAGATLWASTAVAKLVLCDRRDGLWRSDDAGMTWEPVDGLPATHVFHDLPGQVGTVLAGTEVGLRVSLDTGRSWHRVSDPIAQITVYDFDDDSSTVWAGTAEGLFQSKDGVNWAKHLSRYDTDMPVWAVAVDRFWSGGLWLTGPVGVLRSDHGGEELRQAGRNPLMGTLDLLPLAASGHILAAGIDGVWESMDGGVLWRPIAHGLPSAHTAVLGYTGRDPLVAGRDGVYTLVVAEDEIAQVTELTSLVPSGPGVGELVDVALRRPGMAYSNVLTSGKLVGSLLLPKLEITGRTDRRRMLSADHDARSNKGSQRRGWFIGTSLCFGPCSSISAFSDLDVEAIETIQDSGADIADDLIVVGDEVYVADTSGSLAPVAANVAERLTRYRMEIANRVSELVVSRQRLMQANVSYSVLPVRERIRHEIDIQEATARIDVYTNGYLTRVLDGS